MSREIFDEINNLVTESRNPKTRAIDEASIELVLRLINAEDATVPAAVEGEIPYIVRAVELLVMSFRQGGSLFYVGAGTSGRLGVLDAAECPPTFGTDPQMVQGIIAGGYAALTRSQEGAEDDEAQGAADLQERHVTSRDVVCGIAASRRTPYVIGAIKHAKILGARTVYVTCNPRAEMDIEVDVAICPVVGPEVIMGSTRMKAGTATKLVLNMLTTTAMIKLGKVYENMMVDLQMTSRKLEERSKRTVMTVTGLSYEKAEQLLHRAEGHVKTALVMHLANVGKNKARKALGKTQGFVREAIKELITY